MSPARYRSITGTALVALVVIVITGAAVRLTGSGLGCSDWPTCEEDQLIADLEAHAMIEFVNRLITGVVSVAVIAAVLGSFFRRPRRRDLTWLSVGLVAGVIGQIVLGAFVVLTHLNPWLVLGHFLLSMVLVANAVALHARAAQHRGFVLHPADGDRRFRRNTADIAIHEPVEHHVADADHPGGGQRRNLIGGRCCHVRHISVRGYRTASVPA